MLASLAMTLLLTGAVVAVSIGTIPVYAVDAVASNYSGTDHLVVDSQRLSYEHDNVSGAVVVVNNTGTSNLTGNVSVVLRSDNGSIVATDRKSEVSFPSRDTTTVALSYSPPVKTSAFFWWRVTITDS